MTAEAAALFHRDRPSILRRETFLLVVGVAALCLASVVAWWAVAYHRSPTAVVEEFMAADRSGRYADQHPLVTAGAPSSLALAVFQDFRRQMNHSPFDHALVTDSRAEGHRAYVQVALAPSTSGTQPGVSGGGLSITFALDFEDGRWRIDGADTAVSVVGALAALGYHQSARQLPTGWPLPGGFPQSPPGSPASSSPAPAPVGPGPAAPGFGP